MKHLRNTLYVTSENAWLRKEGENVVVEMDGKERGRAPLHMLDGIVGFGRPGASPALMAACAEAGLSLSFLSPNGRFLARVEGMRSGNVLLRRTQYRVADSEAAKIPIVQAIIAAKASNQRTVIQRALRDHGSALAPLAHQGLMETSARLSDIARRSLTCQTVNILRGLEGEAAAAYFAIFNHLIRTEAPEFRFTARSRRPPLDRINALLSFLYAILGHDCRSALESNGLDPQVGFLHTDRPGRNSLALDLMEELRPIMADRLALSLINRVQIRQNDFIIEEAGAVRLTEDARKLVLTAWQERKRESLRHPFLGESAPLGLFPHIQAQLLARHLRGDLDGYPGFIWR